MKIIKEFKEFISKGNALDLAVGVIIGAAFQSIVNSIVNDLIMPLVSFIIGDSNLSEKMWVLREGVDETTTIAIRYGNFLQSLINFLIIGFVIFMLVKTINKLRKPKVEEKSEPVISEEVLLLREIRDNLKVNEKA